MSGRNRWMDCLSLAIVFLMSGCSFNRYSGELLVDKNEVTPIIKLGIRFQHSLPKGLDPVKDADYELVRKLKESGYYTAQYGNDFVGEMVGAFRDCGVEAVDGGRAILDENKGDNAAGNSHILDVIPVSFEDQSGPGGSIVSINIEYRLYDWNEKKLIWKGKDKFFPTGLSWDAKFLGRYVTEKNIAQTFDEKGFIALSSTKKEELAGKYGPEAQEKTHEKIKCVRGRLTSSCAARFRSGSVDADESCKRELQSALAICGG